MADAQEFLGERVDEAVVSVPAYFDVAQRAVTKRAGALAGVRALGQRALRRGAGASFLK